MSATETTHESVKKIVFDWASDASGDASDASTNYYNGLIERAVFIPDGVATPTDQYDVVVNDDDGADVLHANGANLSNAATVLKSHVTDGLGAVVASKLTCVVSNAGDTKEGKVIVYLR